MPTIKLKSEKRLVFEMGNNEKNSKPLREAPLTEQESSGNLFKWGRRIRDNNKYLPIGTQSITAEAAEKGI